MSDEPNTERRRTSDGWHLKKEVNLSIILSVLGVALSGLIAWTDLKKDVAVIQQNIAELRLADQRTNDHLKDTAQRFTDIVGRMEDKLDRLIERKEGRL